MKDVISKELFEVITGHLDDTEDIALYGDKVGYKDFKKNIDTFINESKKFFYKHYAIGVKPTSVEIFCRYRGCIVKVIENSEVYSRENAIDALEWILENKDK